MEREDFNMPLSLKRLQVRDAFWGDEMELVRTEVIPYQWEALNDRVENAAPSFCMRNFKLAGRMNRERLEKGALFQEPEYCFRGFEALPEDPAHLEDRFYGFVFQDSDFSKWIEAVAYSLASHPDPALEGIADQAIEIVCAAQQKDGYLDTYYILNGRDKTFTNLKDHHELYCFGHLAEGAVAYYQATGKDRLLNAARKFADYIDSYFGPGEGKCKGYPGHEIAEMALVRLYEATGEKRYLALARFFIEERGKQPYYFDQENPEEARKHPHMLRYHYYQAHLPVREQKEAVGHAVRAVYLYSGMADIARLTEDESLFEACQRLWRDITGRKMYLTGGIGATHIGEAFSYPYDLPNGTAYAETCASIGLVFFARRMLGISPRGEYADVMERALYNGILSGMALDGKSFFYVNPLEVNPEACRRDERKSHVKAVRQKWFGCACCPPNLARLLGSLGSYAFTENQDTLFVHLYMGACIQKDIGGKQVRVFLESNFPWEGRVVARVCAKGTGFRLALRIPGWCSGFSLTGCSQQEREVKDGYLYIRKQWGEEELLELDFPMEVRLMASHGQVRENAGKVAVTRGPLVYCLEEADNGKNLHQLLLDAQGSYKVQEEEICGKTVNSVAFPGYRRKQGENSLYHVYAREELLPVSLKFVPYYMSANRGENEIQVWVTVKNEKELG